MPTSDFCHPDSIHDASGFSLLEVLVVLVIISIAVGVIGPRLQRTYDAIALSGEREEVLRQLRRLPLIARERHDELRIAAGDVSLAGLLELPQGWSVQPVEEIRVEPSGACHDSRVRLLREGDHKVDEVRLRQPDCRIDER